VTFKAYLENIEKKTRKTPADFRQLARQKGYLIDGKLRPDVKVGEVVAWLKQDFALGHGHAMAIVALLRGMQP